MRKIGITLTMFAVMFILLAASCGKSENTDEFVYYASETTTAETTTIADRSNEEEYLAARKEFYEQVYAEKAANNEEDGLQVYFVDINRDGYKDIVYNAYWFPMLAVYENGEFISVEISSDVCIGSLFPSGRNSGYFIDSEKGVIVIRYGGHTEGTAFYNGAEAFKIDGSYAYSLWEIYSDQEKYYSVDMSEEEHEQAVEQCFEEFESAYRNKTDDYYLVDFYDVCRNWNG